MRPGHPDYFHLIDGLRGLAALAIVVNHYHHFYMVGLDRSTIPSIETFPWASIFAPVYLHGPFAVQLFWVISGLVFAHVYVVRKTSVRAFIAARIARLYPLHLATLLSVALLQAISVWQRGGWIIYGNNDLRHVVLQLGLASNWTTQSRGLSFNGPIWSVSIEFLVYFLFLAVLQLIRRRGYGSALALAVLSLWIGAGPLADWLKLVRPDVFICASYFFAGVAVWCAGAAGRQLPLRVAGSAFAALALGVAAFAMGEGAWLLYPATVAVVTLAAEADRLRRWNEQGIVWLGDLSFAIYLVHVPLQMLALVIITAFVGDDRGWVANAWTLPLYVLATLIVAHLVHTGFERPAGRWIRARFAGPGTARQQTAG